MRTMVLLVMLSSAQRCAETVTVRCDADEDCAYLGEYGYCDFEVDGQPLNPGVCATD